MDIGLMFVKGALEENPFTRLAEEVRAREVPHLKAGHLLPGDLVMIEGWVLQVRDVTRYDGMVALDFDLGGFMFVVPEDRCIEVVQLAASAPCSTRIGALWL